MLIRAERVGSGRPRVGAGAATGGTLGAALGGTAGAIFGRGVAKAATPTVDEIKAAGRAAYQSAEVKGLEVKPSTVATFAQQTKAAPGRLEHQSDGMAMPIAVL